MQNTIHDTVGLNLKTRMMKNWATSIAQCSDTEATISQRVSPAPRKTPPDTRIIASAMT